MLNTLSQRNTFTSVNSQLSVVGERFSAYTVICLNPHSSTDVMGKPMALRRALC